LLERLQQWADEGSLSVPQRQKASFERHLQARDHERWREYLPVGQAWKGTQFQQHVGELHTPETSSRPRLLQVNGCAGRQAPRSVGDGSLWRAVVATARPCGNGCGRRDCRIPQKGRVTGCSSAGQFFSSQLGRVPLLRCSEPLQEGESSQFAGKHQTCGR
jgi:hypothetical protein